MKTAVGTLKGDLAQFRELEAFASFGSELDKVSQATLDRGYRLTELLKQGLNSPLPAQEQVVVLFAGTRGYTDSVPVSEVRRFESGLLDHMRSRHSDILEAIRTSGTIGDEAALEAALRSYVDSFVPSTDGDSGDRGDTGGTAVGGEAEVTPTAAAEEVPAAGGSTSLATDVG